MTPLGDRADVHTATLRAVGAGVATPMVPTTRRLISARSLTGAAHVLRVHPWAWQVALLLASGNARRLVIADAATVYVDLPARLAHQVDATRRDDVR